MFELVDDGTLDTVIRNTDTDEEHRFNYQCSGFEGNYDEFVQDCIETLEDE